VLFVQVLQSLNIWNVIVQTHNYICSFLITIKYSNKIFEVHAIFFKLFFFNSIYLFTVPTLLLRF